MDYDRHAPLTSPTQLLLRNAVNEPSEHVPAGYQIHGSGGRGTTTLSPWVGFFDSDEITSPQRGIYVAYIFAEDLRTVFLSVQQGITQLSNELRNARARAQLGANAELVRARLGEVLVGFDRPMTLGTSGVRQRGYEAANIASKTYTVEALPPEEALRSDLARMLHVHELAASARREASSRAWSNLW